MEPVTSSAAELDPCTGRAKKIRITNSVPQEVNDSIPLPVVTTTADKLCEDELSLIFDNSCLSTKDLLSFRLVNKSWRDAATSILLQKNACYIDLDLQRLVATDGRSRYTSRIKLRFCQRRDEKGILTLNRLTDLMSKSCKFPSSNIHVNTDPDFYKSDYGDYRDLLKFFKVHGKMIKTLKPQGFISLKRLLDFLFTHAPNMECLDLRKAMLWWPVKSKEGNEENAAECTSKLNALKSLAFGRDLEFSSQTDVHMLFSSFPKLSSIENVAFCSLSHILNEGKGHLIRSFECTILSGFSDACISPLQQFAQVHPQLSKLTVNTDHFCLATLASLNALLESSNDSLQHLDLWIYDLPKWKLRIFPMKNLKSIIFRGHGSRQKNPIFEDGMFAPKCFPSLVKLSLINLSVEQNLMCYFQFKLDSDGTVANCLPKVQVLEIPNSTLPKNSHSSLISKFFPNLRVLKVKCENFSFSSFFDNSFWGFCPSVQFVELYDIWVERNENVSSFADKFFTGFCSEMCTKLLTTDLPEFKNQNDGLKFLRIAPSICDLLQLKEFKLTFCEVWAQFASRVTGIYAFSKMPNTQFIISYDPDAFDPHCNCKGRKGVVTHDNDYMDQVELCFAAIKPYVQIVHEKQDENRFY